MTAKQKRSTLLIAASMLPVGNFGCGQPSPPPEAVLEGTWELIPSEEVDPELTGSFLTFNSSGRLTQVTFTFTDETTVRWDNPPSETSVDGDQLHISVTQGGSDLLFDGTLDSETEPTSATGELTRNLTFGDITISESQGEGTLAKQ